MPNFSRIACLALLLGIFLGHTSVAVHAAVHDTGDSVECQLCSSFGNASPAITAEPGGDTLHGVVGIPENATRTQPVTRTVAPCGQRGPPSSR